MKPSFSDSSDGPTIGPVVVDAVRRHGVRRALHQDRIGLRGVLRDVDAGEELDAVAHGDAVVVLGVVRAGVFELLFGLVRGGLLRGEWKK